MKNKSEEVFEAFLRANDVQCENIEEVREKAAHRPEYTVGDHVRRRIEGAKKQIQYGANQGIPSLLLI